MNWKDSYVNAPDYGNLDPNIDSEVAVFWCKCGNALRVLSDAGGARAFFPGGFAWTCHCGRSWQLVTPGFARAIVSEAITFNPNQDIIPQQQ